MRRAPLSAWKTTEGTKTQVCIWAEPLRSKPGALEPRRWPCRHKGAPESASEGLYSIS